MISFNFSVDHLLQLAGQSVNRKLAWSWICMASLIISFMVTLIKGLATVALNTPFLVNCELGEPASSWVSSPSTATQNILSCQQTFRTPMVVAETRMVVGDHVSATDSGGCRGKRRYHHLLLQTGFSCCSNRSHRRVPKPMERSSCWNPTKAAFKSCQEFKTCQRKIHWRSL